MNIFFPFFLLFCLGTNCNPAEPGRYSPTVKKLLEGKTFQNRAVIFLWRREIAVLRKKNELENIKPWAELDVMKLPATSADGRKWTIVIQKAKE